jgi:hypothetical protein
MLSRGVIRWLLVAGLVVGTPVGAQSIKDSDVLVLDIPLEQEMGDGEAPITVSDSTGRQIFRTIQIKVE